MDFSMFLEFPGILILIGVILLILAIVIGIIAYRSPKDDELEQEINENLKESEQEEPIIEESDNDTIEENHDNLVNVPIIEDNQIIIEETEPLEEANKNVSEQEELFIEDNLVVEEPNEEQKEDLVEKKEEIIEEEVFPEEIPIDNNFLQDKIPNSEEIIEEEPKLIYGGANPNEAIELNLKEIEREPYTENISNLDSTEELINTLNNSSDIISNEIKPVNDSNDEEIEVL